MGRQILYRLRLTKYTGYSFLGEASVRLVAGTGTPAEITQIFEVPMYGKYISKLSFVGLGFDLRGDTDVTMSVFYADGFADTHNFTLPYLTETFCDMTPHIDTSKVVVGVSIKQKLHVPPPQYRDCLLDTVILLATPPRVIESQDIKLQTIFSHPYDWDTADTELDGGDGSLTTISSSYGQVVDIIIRLYKSAGAIDWTKILIDLEEVFTHVLDIGRLKTFFNSETKTGTPIEFLHVDDVNEDYVLRIRDVELTGDLTLTINNTNAAGNKIKFRILYSRKTNPM